MTNIPDDKSHMSVVSLDDEGGIYDIEVQGRQIVAMGLILHEGGAMK